MDLSFFPYPQMACCWKTKNVISRTEHHIVLQSDNDNAFTRIKWVEMSAIRKLESFNAINKSFKYNYASELGMVDHCGALLSVIVGSEVTWKEDR